MSVARWTRMPHAQLESDPVAATLHLWYGRHESRRPSELELCWKAAKAIAASDGVLSEEERLALIGKMVATGTPPAVVDAVMSWDAEGDEGIADLLADLDVPGGPRLELGLWIVYEGLS